jgi:hypothetical protein
MASVDNQRPKGDRDRTYTWRDSVRLRKGRQGWLVTDVQRGGSLTGMLRDYIVHGCGRG